jgi:N-acetylmuramoyl-L-alanine amidase
MILLVNRTSLAVVALLLGACAPRLTTPPAPVVGLPPVPRVEGALDIRVQYPSAGVARPRVDSTFIFGSVGNGRATLFINGAPVQVAPNGAFLAFLPVPVTAWELTAQLGDQVARSTVAYRPPAPLAATPPAAAPAPVTFPVPMAGSVTGLSDTLATGSDVARAYPVASTEGNPRWFLPRGARFTAVGTRGGLVQARFNERTTAWIPENQVTLGATTASPTTRAAGAVAVRPAAEYADVRIPAGGAPFLIREDTGSAPRALSVTLYGVTAPTGAPNLTGDPLLAGGSWATDTTGAARLDLQLARPLWGYKVFYDTDGTLVLRVRRPPTVDASQPLRGIRIVVDPGHPPGGAIGPTGLTEAEANLAVGLRLAELLRTRGAEVLMTRTTAAPLVSATNTAAELGARVNFAVRNNAHLLVAPHNNAFGEGQNPFTRYGTEMLYYHPHSVDLARALQREIVDITRIPNLGARFQNIAIGRVTWMPSVITESLFMMFPEQENALRDPAFLDRLAAAHVRGIEAFLRERAP